MSKFTGSPMQVWGLRVRSYTGMAPVAGNVVKVTTKDGTEWYTRITHVISSQASKSGYWMVIGEKKEQAQWISNEIYKGRMTPDGDIVSPAEEGVHVDEAVTEEDTASQDIGDGDPFGLNS